jgi:hypothetical protein
MAGAVAVAVADMSFAEEGGGEPVEKEEVFEVEVCIDEPMCWEL